MVFCNIALGLENKLRYPTIGHGAVVLSVPVYLQFCFTYQVSEEQYSLCIFEPVSYVFEHVEEG
jgi:hypothetical protein